MANGWSVMDALNKNSKAAAEEKPKARFGTKDIHIGKLYANEKNFYSMADIETLAQEILMCGMMENMVVTYAPCERGDYRIIAGERRWRALNLLAEKGYTDFEVATCQVKAPGGEHEERVQLILANAYRDKTVMDVLEEEKQLKESLRYMKDNGLTLQGYALDSGRLRDVIASIMGTTATKIAQIESINKRLIPEFMEELKKGKLTFSAAYELSGMEEKRQQEMLEKHEEGGLTWKEIKEAKAAAVAEKEERQKEQENTTGQQDAGQDPGRTGEEWVDAHPESITSLCYSCKRYSECNVKTGTCRSCDRYINKAEAEKTDEQRYSEEQAAIDRQTHKKLREMERKEEKARGQQEGGEGDRERSIKVSKEMYENIKRRRIPYMIVKEGAQPYREKDILTLIAYQEGRTTGDKMRVCVVCVDNAQTSSAIIDGYAVIGVMDIYDAEDMGIIDLEGMD